MKYVLTDMLMSNNILRFGSMAGFAIYIYPSSGIIMFRDEIDNSYFKDFDTDDEAIKHMRKTSIFSIADKKIADNLDATRYYSEYLTTNEEVITKLILRKLAYICGHTEDFVYSIASLIHLSMGNEETLRVIKIYENMVENTVISKKDRIEVNYAINKVYEQLQAL